MSGKMLTVVVFTAMLGAGSAWAGEANAAKQADAPQAVAATPTAALAPAAANGPTGPLQAPTDTNAVIVTVNGKSLTMGMVNWLQPNAAPAVIKQIADFWVTTQLLNAEAVKRNVTASPKTEFMVQLRTMQVYGGEVIQQVQETATATEADVNDYYSKNKDTDPRLSEPERFSFTHLLVKTLDEAQAALAKVKAGEDIGALARQLSKSPDAASGGAMKKMPASYVQMRYGKEVYAALAAGQDGQLLGPVQTKDGFEVIRHEGRLAAMVKPLDAIKDQIKGELERRAKSAAVEKFISSLKEKAAPEIQKSEFLIQAEKLVPAMNPPGLGGMGPRGGAPRPMPPVSRPMRPPPSAPAAPANEH